MEDVGQMTFIPLIIAAVYWVTNLYKSVAKSEKALAYVPIIAASIGAILGVITFLTTPSLMPADNVITALMLGGSSGLAATGTNQVFKQIKKAGAQDVAGDGMSGAEGANGGVDESAKVAIANAYERVNAIESIDGSASEGTARGDDESGGADGAAGSTLEQRVEQ